MINFAGANKFYLMMETNIKAALFDLDGVVFDTESQYSVFWKKQCRLYHPDKPGLENMIKGQTLVQIFDKYFSEPELKSEQSEIVARLDDFEHNMEYRYVEGFIDFVSSLRENGVKTAVVTSSNLMKMNSVYKAHPKFKDMFDAILTSEDFDRSKPDPDCYIKGAEIFNVGRENCVVFEDSFNGLKAGQAANMKVIGLSTTNSKEAIAPFSDYVIPDYKNLDYSGLCRIVNGLNK